MLRVYSTYLPLTAITGLLLASTALAKSIDTLLETLNQPAITPPQYPIALDTDLEVLRAQEQKAIGVRWNAKQMEMGAQSKATIRAAKNTYFHSQVQALNARVPQWVQANLPSQQVDYRQTAARVLAEVASHPVASIAKTAELKRASEIGYCFGRALLVHYTLLKHEVPQSELVKVFALGELTLEKQFWQFHVAVGVRDPKAGLLIVDPLFPQVQGVAEWTKKVEALDIKAPLSRVLFYVTDPRKFLPAFGAYHKDQLSDPVLRAYFSALADSL